MNNDFHKYKKQVKQVKQPTETKMSETITYKYSANYETKENGETYIIIGNGVLNVPRLIKVVDGVAVTFDYTVHSEYDSDEYRNLLTGELLTNETPF